MSITYSAESLEDIAKAIDILKDRANQRVSEQKTAKGQAYYTGQFVAFQEVAEMLRNTEFRGS